MPAAMAGGAEAPGAYRVADYVPDLVDFLRLELSEPAVVVGHSLGGNLAGQPSRLKYPNTFARSCLKTLRLS